MNSLSNFKAKTICQKRNLFSFFFKNTFILNLSKTENHFFILGSLHTRHFCSRYCDIEIKRYCDKKTFFIQNFFPVCIENIFWGMILNILKCHYNILKKKMSFYRNIFLSQYLFIAISFYRNIFLSQYLFISILCLKMSSVYKP